MSRHSGGPGFRRAAKVTADVVRETQVSTGDETFPLESISARSPAQSPTSWIARARTRRAYSLRGAFAAIGSMRNRSTSEFQGMSIPQTQALTIPPAATSSPPGKSAASAALIFPRGKRGKREGRRENPPSLAPPWWAISRSKASVSGIRSTALRFRFSIRSR